MRLIVSSSRTPAAVAGSPSFDVSKHELLRAHAQKASRGHEAPNHPKASVSPPRGHLGASRGAWSDCNSRPPPDVVSDNGDAELDVCPRGRFFGPFDICVCLRLLGTPTREPGCSFAGRPEFAASDLNTGARADSFTALGFRTVDPADPRGALHAVSFPRRHHVRAAPLRRSSCAGIPFGR